MSWRDKWQQLLGCENSNRPVGSMRQGAGLLGSTQEGRNTAVLSSIPTQR